MHCMPSRGWDWVLIWYDVQRGISPLPPLLDETLRLRSTGQFHTFYCKCMNTVKAKVIVALNCHPLMFVAPQGFLLFSLIAINCVMMSSSIYMFMWPYHSQMEHKRLAINQLAGFYSRFFARFGGGGGGACPPENV